MERAQLGREFVLQGSWLATAEIPGDEVLAGVLESVLPGCQRGLLVGKTRGATCPGPKTCCVLSNLEKLLPEICLLIAQ